LERLLLAVDPHREESIALGRGDGGGELGRCGGEDRGDLVPLEAAAMAEEVARRAVGEQDAVGGADEERGDRHAVEERVEEQLALEDVAALVAQGLGDLVVDRDQLTYLVLAVDREAER